MAKFNWEGRRRYEKVDHYQDAIERNKKSKPSEAEQKQAAANIKLGIHEDHDWEVVICASPHAGKIVCKTCGDKFVTWLPKILVSSLK